MERTFKLYSTKQMESAVIWQAALLQRSNQINRNWIHILSDATYCQSEFAHVISSPWASVF